MRIEKVLKGCETPSFEIVLDLRLGSSLTLFIRLKTGQSQECILVASCRLRAEFCKVMIVIGFDEGIVRRLLMIAARGIADGSVYARRRGGLDIKVV